MSDTILVKQFQNLHITVHGTYEEPLFKAKDIGELLDIRNIRHAVSNFNDKQRCVVFNDTPGGKQDVVYLTEQGLYKLLMRSRKKVADQFQDWVCEVIKEIRLKGKYDLQEKLKEKEQELLKLQQKTFEEIERTGHLYVIKTDALNAYKIGKTKDAVNKRVKGMQTGNVDDIQIMLDFPTSNPDLLERLVHYILDRYRCNSNREFFDCNLDYIKTVISICGNTMDTLKSTYQHISSEELTNIFKERGLTPFKQDELGAVVRYNPRRETDELFMWLDANLVRDEDGLVELRDISNMFKGKECTKHEKAQLKLQIEKWIRQNHKHLDSNCRYSKHNNVKFNGWRGLRFDD